MNIRARFCFFATYLGERGFDYFHLCANLSLCTNNPTRMFAGLVALLRTAMKDNAIVASWDECKWLAIASKLAEEFEIKMLGTSIEVRKNDDLSHPVYDNMLRVINEACYREEHLPDGFSMFRYFQDPERFCDRIAVEASRPIVFNRMTGRRWPIYIAQVKDDMEGRTVKYSNIY